MIDIVAHIDFGYVSSSTFIFFQDNEYFFVEWENKKAKYTYVYKFTGLESINTMNYIIIYNTSNDMYNQALQNYNGPTIKLDSTRYSDMYYVIMKYKRLRKIKRIDGGKK